MAFWVSLAGVLIKMALQRIIRLSDYVSAAMLSNLLFRRILDVIGIGTSRRRTTIIHI